MKMVFKFRDGSRLNGDPQVVGKALTAIRDRLGHLTAPDVVEEARPVGNALHRYFEWEDAKAAEQYRLEQARLLVRSVVITETEEHGEIHPVRAFAKISTENIDSYEPIHRVLADKDLRDRLLRECKGEIKSLRDKLASYEELTNVIGALNTVEKVVDSHLKEAVLG